MTFSPVQAVTLLEPGELVSVAGSEKQSFDYKLPDTMDAGTLEIAVRGGDGGRRYYKADWFPLPVKYDDHYAGGGGGAFLETRFRVGPDGIPPGSLIRLIPGQAGDSYNYMGNAAAAGGGGSGVIFQAPGEEEWTVLIAAGGGGGAHSDCCAIKNDGGNASASDCSHSGGGDSSGANGPTGGGSQRGGGGGATGDAKCSGSCDGVSGGRKGMPEGGSGGSKGRKGGWGFGGGGHSQGEMYYAGGGGGYCGGDAKNVAHGKGGGSFINAGLLQSNAQPMRQNGSNTGKSPRHGYIEVTLHPAITGKLAFVTSSTHTGLLGSGGIGVMAGAEAADEICNQRADEAGLPGFYRAWLVYPEFRFETTLAEVHPLVRVDGVELGMLSELLAGEIQHPLNVTETGEAITDPGVRVWSDVEPGPGLPDPSCGSWIYGPPDFPTGTTGLINATDGSWSRTSEEIPCEQEHRLYCIQQAVAESVRIGKQALPVPGQAGATRQNLRVSVAEETGVVVENDHVQLVWRSDGNLVLSDTGSGATVWETGTGNYRGDKLAFQSDGNLVIYGPNGPVWASGTEKNGGATQLQLVYKQLRLYNGSETVWESPLP